mmetsp:Transcript_7545/g.26929  ORF Transcript_7545/g.26929 Transcript_7545/m.26929 type:complete len:198 (-) Transcript_7545:261-854(-)
MKVLSVHVLRWNNDTPQPVMLSAAHDLSEFGFFQRGGVQEMLTFVARTLTQRLTGMQVVDHEGYHCHVVVKTDGLASVMVTDLEYPARVAFQAVQGLLDEFNMAQPEWRAVTVDGGADFPGTEACLKKYQNPREVDKIMRIQADLEETKEVLHQTIDAVLERGTKLEELVDKSDDLSAQSKMFYKQAKKTNKCCTIS